MIVIGSILICGKSVQCHITQNIFKRLLGQEHCWIMREADELFTGSLTTTQVSQLTYKNVKFLPFQTI
jgi:hypothetical protein